MPSLLIPFGSLQKKNSQGCEISIFVFWLCGSQPIHNKSITQTILRLSQDASVNACTALG